MRQQELPDLELLHKANEDLSSLWNPFNHKHMQAWLHVASDTLQQNGINVVVFDKATIKISKPLHNRFLEVQGIHKSGIPSCEEISNKEVFMATLEGRVPKLSIKRARPSLEDCFLRILGFLTQKAITGKKPSKISIGFLKHFLGISNGKKCKLIWVEFKAMFSKYLEINHNCVSLTPEAGINFVMGSNSDLNQKLAEVELDSVGLKNSKQRVLAQVSHILGYCEKDNTGAMVLSVFKTTQNFLCLEGYRSIKAVLPTKNFALDELEKTWETLNSKGDSHKKSNEFESLERIHSMIYGVDALSLVNKSGDARIYHPLVCVSKRVRNSMFGNTLDDVDISACFPSILPVVVKEYLMEIGEYEDKKEAFLDEVKRWNSHQDPYMMPFIQKGFCQPDRAKGKKILNSLLNAPVSFGNVGIGCVLSEFKIDHPIFAAAISCFYKNRNVHRQGIFYYRASKWEQKIVTHLQMELYRKGIPTVNFHDGFMMKKGSASIDEIKSLLDAFVFQMSLDVNLKIKIK